LEAVAALLKFFMGLTLVHFQKYWLLRFFTKLIFNSRPSSVFLLAVASVILNTYPVDYALSFKYAVVILPLMAMTRAFLSLPFQFVISENSVQ
jgi:hypothetical protein